jgi:hypothetical protein
MSQGKVKLSPISRLSNKNVDQPAKPEIQLDYLTA